MGSHIYRFVGFPFGIFPMAGERPEEELPRGKTRSNGIKCSMAILVVESIFYDDRQLNCKKKKMRIFPGPTAKPPSRITVQNLVIRSCWWVFVRTA